MIPVNKGTEVSDTLVHLPSYLFSPVSVFVHPLFTCLGVCSTLVHLFELQEDKQHQSGIESNPGQQRWEGD